jgi:hypothetical protein
MSLEHDSSDGRCGSGIGATLTVLTVASLTVAALVFVRRARGASSRPENLLTICDKAVRALDDRIAAVAS